MRRIAPDAVRLRVPVAIAASGLTLLSASPSIVGPAAAEPPIVVNGIAPDPAAVETFVERVTGEESDDQIARWSGPVCPAVSGLAAAQNAYVAETVTAVAAAVGLPPAASDCAPNLIVLFTATPTAEIRALEQRRPALFRSLSPGERRRLAADEGPVRSWNMVFAYGADGRAASARFDANGARPSHGIPGNAGTQYLTGVLPSRITRATRQDIVTRMIVIDADAAAAFDLNRVSGFVAMAALSGTVPEQAGHPGRSIAALFVVDEPPPDLTAWDIAFLRALYASDNKRDAGVQRAQIARLMGEILAGN